jgi:outer membrane protein OmpA-like peptidoglycan-associated protein
MKKIILMLIATSGALSTYAQAPKPKNYATDVELSRWVIDLNLKGGLATQEFKTANSNSNYLNGVNMNTGLLNFKNGYSLGGDLQLGFFVGKKRHFGLGAGIMYMSQQGNAALDNYHVEYQATDGAGNIFRQVITGNIKEEIRSSIINVPVVLKYKNRFSKHWGFTADAGALINLQMNNSYTTRASFNHEAIYKFVPNDGGGKTSVYDNSSVPSSSDWLITRQQFYRNNPNGDLQDYFNKKRALGYNVGDGYTPTTSTGKTSYKTASVGLLIQPSLNYFLSDNVALNLGVYYMFQPFKNDAQSNYRLTDGKGDYSSVLNNVTESKNQAYGMNIGVRFFLGKKRQPMTISSIDQKSPSQCGLCDGNISLKGLSPNQPVTVDYSLNGAKPNVYTTTVQPNGQVSIDNLCAGNYTGIVAKISRKSANGKDVTLSEPKLKVSSQKAVNPTAAGSCNGSNTFEGMYAGKSVTINYRLNGNDQAAYTGIVNSDRSITMNSLCEGNYSDIVLTCNTCTTKGDDFTLSAPKPTPAPPPPPVPVEVAEEADMSSTVLFEFDKSEINSEYYPILNKAYKEMKDDEYIVIRVDGHTDLVGTNGYNQKLSERRTQAVKSYFTKKGVHPGRIKMYSHGEDKPEESNATEEGRRLNRRVIILTSKK